MERLIEVRSCSITDAKCDVVVNPSNERARLGGGVSRALFDACGGAVLQDAMDRAMEANFPDGFLDEGDYIVTTAGTSRKMHHIIHVPAVDHRVRRKLLPDGSVDAAVTSPERIRVCTEVAVAAAADDACLIQSPISLALPLMGAGAGGLPPHVACEAMIAGIKAGLAPLSEVSSYFYKVVVAVPEPERRALVSRVFASAFEST